jgi:hypothetical protein
LGRLEELDLTKRLIDEIGRFCIGKMSEGEIETMKLEKKGEQKKTSW